MKKNILVLAAHPDDETLGCGGTIAKLIKSQKYNASVVFFTDGVSSRSNKNKKKIKERRLNCKSACNLIGFNKIKFNNFPDNKLDTLPLIKLVNLIEKELIKLRPDIIFTHHEGDLNIDHQLVSRATFTATRNYNKKKYMILTYEVLSSTDLNYGRNNSNFKPNSYFDIKNTINIKIKALNCYKDEVRKFPHPRSEKGLRILAGYRGMFCDLEYAESFEIRKYIN